MAADDSEQTGPHDLNASMIFVRHGDPPPTEWMARNPGYVRIPAVMVPREPRGSSSSRTYPVVPAAAVGSAAAAAVPSLLPEIDAGAGLTSILSGLTLEALAAVGILIYPKSTASPENDELQKWLKVPGNKLDQTPAPSLPGLKRDQVPELPPPPGLVVPEENRTAPGEGGFTPSPPTRPVPGFTPEQPRISVLPGPAANEEAPTILRQDRNEGLQGGVRTTSKRAREAAKLADPTVTQALQEAEWRAHHLINVAAVRSTPDLVTAASRAGWRTDDVGNVAPLPASPDAQEKLKAAGIERPVHDNGHRGWNDEVVKELEEIRRKLRLRGLPKDSDVMARAARDELQKLQDKLRGEMLKSKRLTENETTAAGALA